MILVSSCSCFWPNHWNLLLSREWRCSWSSPDNVIAYLGTKVLKTATFVPPLSDQKNYQDAQWSLKPREFCFCVTAMARPLCLPWTTKAAVVAPPVAHKEATWRQSHCRGGSRVPVVAWWRQSGRHSDRSMGAISRPKEAQRWYKEGWNMTQIDAPCLQQYAFFAGRPGADPCQCASILRSRRYMCLPPAHFEQPVSDQPPQRPLCDCLEHIQNFTATMASVAGNLPATCEFPHKGQWRAALLFSLICASING